MYRGDIVLEGAADVSHARHRIRFGVLFQP